jgi:hypothetical protein
MDQLRPRHECALPGAAKHFPIGAVDQIVSDQPNLGWTPEPRLQGQPFALVCGAEWLCLTASFATAANAGRPIAVDG